MPTFQSIPLHPSVSQRLLQSTSGSAGNDGQQQQRQLQPNAAKVETPRALLTRDPQALVDLFANNTQNAQQQSLLLEQMEGIRHQVALEMCHQTNTGKYILQKQKEHGNIQEPLVPGVSMSALQLKNMQQERELMKDQPYILSTGCRALDELIAFPKEYQLSSNQQSQQGMEDETSPSSVSWGGLPRGYILALTGTTGKTQLCLQLAAQMCFQTKHQRVRYCYSTAGHSGYYLAKRFKALVDASSSDRRIKHERMKQVDFVPIADSTQLLVVLAGLEEEWMQRQQQRQQQRQATSEEVAVLILDSLPLMMGENNSAGHLERWLKRMARQHSVWVVVTGTASTSAAPLDVYDIRLQLSPGVSSSLTSVDLMRHPTKLVTKQDQVTLLNTNDFGMTTQG